MPATHSHARSRRRACGALSFALVVVAALAPTSAQPGPPLSGSGAEEPVVIHGVPYEKLESRAATEARMMSLMFPSAARWGGWYVITPFPYKGVGDIGTPQGPEAELSRMGPNGPGPDLQAQYDAKPLAGGQARRVGWRPLGDIANRVIDINEFQDKGKEEYSATYFYATIEVDEPTTVEITMGSDDGLRFWFNGRLLVDTDVTRGVDANDHRLRLDLVKGKNHLLAKVAQVLGGYGFQVNRRPPLDDATDMLLQYHLDRDFPSSPEAEYYAAYSVNIPPEIALEVGGLDTLPDGRPIVSTRRGEVWIIDGVYDEPPFAATFTLFASGLHEPLGLAVRTEREGGKDVAAVYCVQRGELTRMVDTSGDWKADLYETVSDAWGVSGNYHEFAFGPKFDAEGNAYVTLNVGFCGSLGKSVVPWRGWALKVAPDGTTTPVCTGLRSPNGIGMFSDGAMFYLDNQGDFIGTNRMTWLKPGSFHGQPSGLRWQEGYRDGAPTPPVQPATIWFPYRKLGQSTADFLLYDRSPEVGPPSPPTATANFGPFEGQVFVGDQTQARVMRVFIEKVETPDGPVYQGAAFPFREGLDCGVNRLAWGKDGSMLVGQTDRGWGSIGRRRYGLQRLVFTGKVPFEVQEMRARPDGFELVFTRDIDPASAADIASYKMISYTYEYHAPYGSDEMETRPVAITGATVVDARTVRLTVDGLRAGGMGYVHELTLPGVRAKAADGAAPSSGGPSEGLLHPVAYYTLQVVPAR